MEVGCLKYACFHFWQPAFRWNNAPKGGTMAQPSFPVIIFETLANFFFPSLSMLIAKTFVPKQTPETNIAGTGGTEYTYS